MLHIPNGMPQLQNIRYRLFTVGAGFMYTYINSKC